MNVTIYTTPTCGWCRRTKEFLSRRGIRYTERDVSTDRAAAEEMVTKSGQMGVPVIVIDGEVIAGFDQARLEDILSRQPQAGRPSLGLRVADAVNIARKQSSVPVFGAYVGSVRPGSAAEQAGLQPGDIITELNLHPIRNAADLEQVVASLREGASVNVVFLRGQETHSTKVAI